MQYAKGKILMIYVYVSQLMSPDLIPRIDMDRAMAVHSGYMISSIV